MHEGDMIRTRSERVRRRRGVWALQNATLIGVCFFSAFLIAFLVATMVG